jgi:hypothetical protein
VSDEAFSTAVISGWRAGVRDDGFAGGGDLRRRNCAVGGEPLAAWKVWVRASSQSDIVRRFHAVS